jgi:hypothetical protein
MWSIREYRVDLVEVWKLYSGKRSMDFPDSRQEPITAQIIAEQPSRVKRLSGVGSGYTRILESWLTAILQERK